MDSLILGDFPGVIWWAKVFELFQVPHRGAEKVFEILATPALASEDQHHAECKANPDSCSAAIAMFRSIPWKMQ